MGELQIERKKGEEEEKELAEYDTNRIKMYSVII